MTDYIGTMDTSYPSGQLQRNQVGVHIRDWKQAVYNTLKNCTGEVSCTHTELNSVNGMPNSIADMLMLAATKSGSTYTISPTPAVTSLTEGARFNFQADAACADGQTLTVSALSAVNIKTSTGLSLAANDIVANQVVEVVYDGTNFVRIK